MIAPMLLLFFAASTAGFEFFVERVGVAGGGVCVVGGREHWTKEVVPLHDIRGAERPVDELRSWTDGWRMRNVSLLPRTDASPLSANLDHKSVVTDGSDRFKNVGNSRFLLLAANATLLWSENEDWHRGRSFRVHLNHLDPETGRKATWAEFCTDLSAQGEKCERSRESEDKASGRDVLSDGRKLTYIKLVRDYDTMALETTKDQILVRWSTINTTFQDLESHELQAEHVFARTHSLPGVFWVPLELNVRPVGAPNEMSRDFRVAGPDGKLCLSVEWRDLDYRVGRFELNDPEGRVVRQGALVNGDGLRTRLEFDLGQGGRFRLRLLDLKARIRRVLPCAGVALEVSSRCSGCVAFEGYDPIAKSPAATIRSAPRNASVTVDLTQEEMREVCAALAAGPVEELTFNSRWGSNTRKCPEPDASG